MRRRNVAIVFSTVAVVVFVFAPFIPMTTANFGHGPDYTALVSPSFALFQCGDFIGHVGIQVSNGATVNPYKPYSSFWHCDYPRINW
jgi:hypothetical protein